MPDLAKYVLRRVQRSSYLLGAMRQALGDLGRPDLVAVLDLALQDANESQAACEHARIARRQSRSLRIRLDLQAMADLGGPKARRLAAKVTRRIHP